MIFFFNFLQSIGKVQIDEPFGLDATPFVIRQEENRKGRDTLYAGDGDAKFTITKARDKYGFYFEQFLRDSERYYHELQIELIIDLENGTEIVGNVSDVNYNGNDEISFVVIQKLSEARFKLNYDIHQNLFSGIGMDGTPVVTPTLQQVLVPPKPIIQQSEYKLAPFNFNPPVNVLPNEFAILDNGVEFNPIMQQIEAGVENSLTWITNTADSGEQFQILLAASNLNNVKFRFVTDILYKYRPNEVTDVGDKAGSLGLYIRIGQTFASGVETVVWYNGSNQESDMDFQLPNEMEVTIPQIQSTSKVWVYFRVGSQNAAVNRIQFSLEDRLYITATSTAIPTVVPCIRYIDAFRYVCQSSSGLNPFAPIFEQGGEFYNQFITNSNLMRLLLDKAFTLSAKDFIEEHIRPEINGDFEIDANNNVFLGLYAEYYRDYLMGQYSLIQGDTGVFETFTRNINPRYALKSIKTGFKNFYAQKESERGNTFDTVHANIEHVLPNELSTNTIDAMAGFIRDPFLIDDMQRKSQDLTNTAATQDDEKIVILDVTTLAAGRNYTLIFELQHTFDDINNKLILTNIGNFNFESLGMALGGTFQIIGGANEGIYTISIIEPRVLTLFAAQGAENIESENTTFKYYIDPAVTLVLRTNEGFENIEGLADGDNFGNLRFTSKRTLRKYRDQQLATACLPYPNKPIKNTLYVNNPNAITQETGLLPIREGEDYIPTGAILTPYQYTLPLSMSLQEFLDLSNTIRTERGYIRTYNTNGFPLDGYIRDAKWLSLSGADFPADERIGVVECTIEEKYTRYLINIIATNQFVMFNDNVQPTGFTFSFDDSGYFTFFDSTGKQLYPPVSFERIKVNNNGNFTSAVQMGMVLSQYDISG